MAQRNEAYEDSTGGGLLGIGPRPPLERSRKSIAELYSWMVANAEALDTSAAKILADAAKGMRDLVRDDEEKADRGKRLRLAEERFQASQTEMEKLKELVHRREEAVRKAEQLAEEDRRRGR